MFLLLLCYVCGCWLKYHCPNQFFPMNILNPYAHVLYVLIGLGISWFVLNCSFIFLVGKNNQEIHNLLERSMLHDKYYFIGNNINNKRHQIITEHQQKDGDQRSERNPGPQALCPGPKASSFEFYLHLICVILSWFSVLPKYALIELKIKSNKIVKSCRTYSDVCKSSALAGAVVRNSVVQSPTTSIEITITSRRKQMRCIREITYLEVRLPFCSDIASNCQFGT